MPFQVWFLKEARTEQGFAIRYNVPSGFGAVQLRPSFVTSATAPSGYVHNLRSEDLRNSFLLYRNNDSDSQAWRQFPLWDSAFPAPEALPDGEWCLFTPQGRSLRPARDLQGWPRLVAADTETEPTEVRSGGRKALRKALRVRSKSVRRAARVAVTTQRVAAAAHSITVRTATMPRIAGLEAVQREPVRLESVIPQPAAVPEPPKALPEPEPKPQSKSRPKRKREREREPRPLPEAVPEAAMEAARATLQFGAPLSAVRHLRRLNERLMDENRDLRDRLAELERLLGH